MNENILSCNIARLRKAHGLTQDALASKLGVTYQAVSKWENGASCPDVMLLPEIANIFNVTVDNLFGRECAAHNYERSALVDVSWDDDSTLRIALFRGKELLREIPEDKLEKMRKIPVTLSGAPMNVSSVLDVHVADGDICGDVFASGNVHCCDVDGNISAGGDITCCDISGDADAQGLITCSHIVGNATAGSIECTDISGDVSADGDITCDEINGDVSCSIVTAGEINGDIRCDSLTADQINGDIISAGIVNCDYLDGDVYSADICAGGSSSEEADFDIDFDVDNYDVDIDELDDELEELEAELEMLEEDLECESDGVFNTCVENVNSLAKKAEGIARRLGGKIQNKFLEKSGTGHYSRSGKHGFSIEYQITIDDEDECE